MVKSSVPCHSLQTTREKRWPYDEYYFGDQDDEERKNGKGENHWTGAESIEWYTGPMLHDTMHGEGDYRWRFKDPDGSFVTYEGQFYANRLHGYGIMSYPDGRVFTGLFYNNVRWGPGVERTASLTTSVGLWRGTQLARLNWRPNGPSIVPELVTGHSGPSFLDPFRIVFTKKTKIVGETNSALELLKKFGAHPLQAVAKWTKVYSKYSTDMDSALCHKDLFDHQYYHGQIDSLEEAHNLGTELIDQDDNGSKTPDVTVNYFAWNNNPMMLHMMKHSYQHEEQRERTRLNLEKVLNGPRNKFRPASQHERDCRVLLLASYLGNIATVAQLVNEKDVYPDVSDLRGNTAVMYAVCGDQPDVIHFLIEAGATVNTCNDSCCTPLGVALIRYLCVALDVPPSAMVQVLLPPNQRIENIPYNTKEWFMNREFSQAVVAENKIAHFQSLKKMKSVILSSVTKKTEVLPIKTTNTDIDYESDEDIFNSEKKLFLTVSSDYGAKLNKQLVIPVALPKANHPNYLFEVYDMLKDIEAAEEEMIKALAIKDKDKHIKTISKAYKDFPKSAVIIDSVGSESLTSVEKYKYEMLSKIFQTIIQLLADGANPMMVKCPQPAILIATESGCSALIQHLVSHGADVNEKFPQLLDYTALDTVISKPFSKENIHLIRTLLENGADTSHRLKMIPRSPGSKTQMASIVEEGPTLLHAVIAKKTEKEIEEQIQSGILELLLDYNANPTAQFHGRSPIEWAMTRKFDLLDVFIKNASAYLNSAINKYNHTILVKLFSREYFKTILGLDKFPTLTNLLLYGADPLIECYDGDVRYENVFEFARKTFNDIAPQSPVKASSPVSGIK